MTYLKVFLLSSIAILAVSCSKSDQAKTGEGADGLTPVRLQTDWYAQPEHGGFYYALAEGSYEQAGLNVTIAQGGPNTISPMLVARGQADMGIGRVDDIALRIQKGLDLIIVAAQMQHDPQGLLLHADNPISSIPELDNQRVMVTPGSVLVQMMEKKYDLTIRIQPLDYGVGRFLSDPEYIQQCFVTSEPYYARKNGVESKVILISEMGFDPYRVIFANRKFVQSQPEAVKAFVKASIEGWARYVDEDTDISAANAHIAAENKIMDDPELVAFTVDAMREYRLIHGVPEEGDVNGLLRLDRMQSVVDMMQELEILDEISDAHQIYTTEFLPEELQAMLSEEEKVPFESE